MEKESKIKIQILLSTYNGAKYLAEQLDSILAQRIILPCELSILIRDDGSSDDGKTLAIIEQYQKKHPQKINMYNGSNIGACGSFFDLVKNADISCDYFAFSDQDDFWLSNKLQLGMEKLQSATPNVPTVYSTQIKIVDEKLNEIKGQQGKKVRRASFGNALLENIVTGCTAIFNKTMLLELKRVTLSHIHEGLFMHDWTLYLISMSFGKHIYEPSPSVLYRQHDDNALGAPRGIINSYVRKYKLLKKYSENNVFRKNLIVFYNIYKDKLNDEQKYLVQLYLQKNISLSKRLALLFNKEIYRQSFFDNIAFKSMVLFNVYLA